MEGIRGAVRPNDDGLDGFELIEGGIGSDADELAGGVVVDEQAGKGLDAEAECYGFEILDQMAGVG